MRLQVDAAQDMTTQCLQPLCELLRFLSYSQGLTDKYIGSWMKSKKRDDIVLATKVRSAAAATYVQRNACSTAAAS
jgi:hypothetical protein